MSHENVEHWKKQRMRALVRDNFSCQAHRLKLCPVPCGVNNLKLVEVHHIRPVKDGGGHEIINLITLCRDHHLEMHTKLEKKKRRESQ